MASIWGYFLLQKK